MQWLPACPLTPPSPHPLSPSYPYNGLWIRLNLCDSTDLTSPVQFTISLVSHSVVYFSSVNDSLSSLSKNPVFEIVLKSLDFLVFPFYTIMEMAFPLWKPFQIKSVGSDIFLFSVVCVCDSVQLGLRLCMWIATPHILNPPPLSLTAAMLKGNKFGFRLCQSVWCFLKNSLFLIQGKSLTLVNERMEWNIKLHIFLRWIQFIVTSTKYEQFPNKRHDYKELKILSGS